LTGLQKLIAARKLLLDRLPSEIKDKDIEDERPFLKTFVLI
jgi:hypothetical protein